jgi:hypothetical protein
MSWLRTPNRCVSAEFPDRKLLSRQLCTMQWQGSRVSPFTLLRQHTVQRCAYDPSPPPRMGKGQPNCSFDFGGQPCWTPLSLLLSPATQAFLKGGLNPEISAANDFQQLKEHLFTHVIPDCGICDAMMWYDAMTSEVARCGAALVSQLGIWRLR